MRICHVCVGWLSVTAVLAAVPASAAPPRAPAYIKADRAAVEKAFGAAITGNIFSDRLTGSRKKLVAATLKANPAPGCKGAPGFTLVAISPIQANQEGTIWEERYEIACEPRVRRSALITATRKTGLQMIESVPGDTSTDTKLRKEFVPKLLEVAAAPGCEAPQITVADSRTLAMPEKAGAPWSESWTLNACGMRKEIEVAFTPDAAAGVITWQFTPK